MEWSLGVRTKPRLMNLKEMESEKQKLESNTDPKPSI